jgi:hypothetical protein
MKQLILLCAITLSSSQLICCPCGIPADNSKPFFEQYEEEETESSDEECVNCVENSSN